MRNLLLINTSCFFNKTHARISACSLAESASIYPKQCRKLKSNWLTGKLRKDNETKWLTGTEKATMFLFRVSRRMPKIKTSNKGQTTGQKFGFQKQLWKFTAIALNKIIKELNQRNRRRRLRSYGLVNLVGLSKIYSCWFIPDFTRNHVISYTNESRRFLTLITVVAFKSRSINTQTLIVPVCKPSLACCVILARIFLTSILRKERKREI